MRLDLLPVSPVVHWALRSLAGQLLVDALPVEADNPGASDLDNRYSRLTRLSYDVPRRIWVAFYVDLLERYTVFFEVTFPHTLHFHEPAVLHRCAAHGVGGTRVEVGARLTRWSSCPEGLSAGQMLAWVVAGMVAFLAVMCVVEWA
jgi:hypothetical protein